MRTHIVLGSTAISTGDSVRTPSHPLPLSSDSLQTSSNCCSRSQDKRCTMASDAAILRQMELANLTLGLFCFHPLIIYIIICCILLLWPKFLVMCRYLYSAVRIGALPILKTEPCYMWLMSFYLPAWLGPLSLLSWGRIQVHPIGFTLGLVPIKAGGNWVAGTEPIFSLLSYRRVYTPSAICRYVHTLSTSYRHTLGLEWNLYPFHMNSLTRVKPCSLSVYTAWTNTSL